MRGRPGCPIRGRGRRSASGACFRRAALLTAATLLAALPGASQPIEPPNTLTLSGWIGDNAIDCDLCLPSLMYCDVKRISIPMGKSGQPMQMCSFLSHGPGLWGLLLYPPGGDCGSHASPLRESRGSSLIGVADPGPAPQTGFHLIEDVALPAGTYWLSTVGDQYSFYQTTIVCKDTQPLLGSCPAYDPQIPLDQQVCLLGKYRVTVDWGTSNSSGRGTPVRMGADDSAVFWFFSPNNWEIKVKVLNGCPVNGYVWVFAAATTNQAYTLKVVELSGGAFNRFRTYSNPLGVRSPAITDTAAFSCP